MSDGLPGDPEKALRVAKRYQNRLSTIYIGDETDPEGGRAFLAKLAQASGGQAVVAAKASELGRKIERLLLSA